MDYRKAGNKDRANCFIPRTPQGCWALREDARRNERTLDRKGAGYGVKRVHSRSSSSSGQEETRARRLEAMPFFDLQKRLSVDLDAG